MKRIVPVALSVSLAFGPIAPVLAAVTCVPVLGKALNNGLNPTTTLGVASVTFGDRKTGSFEAIKCALWGTKMADVPLTFQHVLSCDDNDILFEGRPVHSRVVLSTTGAFTGGDGANFLTFDETSVPVLDTGGGHFANVTGGSLRVTGTVFLRTGAVDMKFEGNICYGS